MEFKELITSKFNDARDKRWFGLQVVAATVSGEVAIAFQSGRRCKQSCRARSPEDVAQEQDTPRAITPLGHYCACLPSTQR